MPESHSEHPNVVPLIDIMLCIIVFYMLVAKIGVATGEQEGITLPETLFGAKLELTNTLVLNVTATETGDLPIITAANEEDGQPVSLSAGDPQTSQLALALRRARFGKDLREGGTGPNADNVKLRVVLRADAERVKIRHLVPVMQAISEARIENIDYNTRRRE